MYLTIAGCEVRVSCCAVRVACYGLRGTCYELRVAGFAVRVAWHAILDVRCWLLASRHSLQTRKPKPELRNKFILDLISRILDLIVPIRRNA